MNKHQIGCALFLILLLWGGTGPADGANTVQPLLQEAESLDRQATYRDEVLELKALFRQNQAMIELLKQILEEQKASRKLLSTPEKKS